MKVHIFLLVITLFGVLTYIIQCKNNELTIEFNKLMVVNNEQIGTFNYESFYLAFILISMIVGHLFTIEVLGVITLGLVLIFGIKIPGEYCYV